MAMRGSWWSITINNPTDEDRLFLRAPPEFVKEMIYQDEVGTTGTLHIQGCLNTNQQRMTAIKEWLPRAHIEKAYKQNGEALKNYCRKTDTAVPETQVHYTTRQTDRQTNDIEEATPPPMPVFSLKEVLLVIASHAHEDDITELDLAELYHATLDRIARACPDLLEKVTRQNVFQAWKHTGYAFLDYLRAAAESEDADEISERLDDCAICDCDKDECIHCSVREKLLLLVP